MSEVHPLKDEIVYLPKGELRTEVLGPEKAETNAARPGVVAAAAAYFNDPERLHGDSVAEVTLQTEKPIHRMMLYMHAQGASVADISKQTGYTKTTIYTVLRQPWARTRLTQLLADAGKDAVKHFLTHEVAPSLEVLREIRDCVEEKGPTRVMAADKILDRALGKPIARVETDNTTRNVPADLQRLEAEIIATQQQIADRGLVIHGPS